MAQGNGGIIGPVQTVCSGQSQVIHTKTSTGSLTLQSKTTAIDYIVVAGGAGGGGGYGGGGGAGGFRTGSGVTVCAGAQGDFATESAKNQKG